MPHPSVLSGYEELLEVAEAILFSVPLPTGVLDKYKMIQKEVKDRIRDAVSREPDLAASNSLRSQLGEDDRAAVLAEKLQQSKRKNAELRTQVASLEFQLSQMTQRVQQLHALHANSAAELVAQTKHACEASAARSLLEAEDRIRGESARARQVASDALDSERAFHASILRKVQAMEQMFPSEYEGLRQEQQGLEQSLAEGRSPLLAALASPASVASRTTDGSNPNSLSRLHLSRFFELTRRALNDSRHLRVAEAEAREEARQARERAPLEEAFRLAAHKAARTVAARVAELSQEIGSSNARDGVEQPSAWMQQREEIVAQVAAVERRMRQQQQQSQQQQRQQQHQQQQEELKQSLHSSNSAAATSVSPAAFSTLPRHSGRLRPASVEQQEDSRSGEEEEREESPEKETDRRQRSKDEGKRTTRQQQPSDQSKLTEEEEEEDLQESQRWHRNRYARQDEPPYM